MKKRHSIMNLLSSISLLGCSGLAIAADAVLTEKMSENITANFSQLARLIAAGMYVFSIIFFILAIWKFKQHKDNPSKTRRYPAMVFLVLAAVLFGLGFLR